MIRKIIRIDKEKCNGCGACATACHEGAIDIINGKAELARCLLRSAVRERYRLQPFLKNPCPYSAP